MKLNLNKISNDFPEFISTIKKSSEPHLASFSFFIEDFDVFTIPFNSADLPDDIFIFQSPNNNNLIFAAGSVLEFNSNSEFNLVSATFEFNKWKRNNINNWEKFGLSSLPILNASFKFDYLKPSEQWNDFNSFRINIPEFLFFKQINNSIGCYNLIIDSNFNTNQILNHFNDRLKNLVHIFEAPSQLPNDNTLIVISERNNYAESWKTTTEKAIQVLQAGIVEKLVISRPYELSFNTQLDWNALLKKLNKRFPDCYLFFIRRKKSVFFGSSPEMFLKVSGDNAEVESVAGSAPRSEVFETDRVLEKNLKTSDKNQLEHQYVSQFISDVLKKFSNNVRITEEKQIKKLDNIQHLITRISAELNNNNLFELINSLFPTPAVCGVPKETAMSFIRHIETHDRGLYSGLIGWLDFNFNCELAVAIRSALVRNNKVTAYAGAGLVKNSDLNEEFQETNLKLDPILSLFNRKNINQE